MMPAFQKDSLHSVAVTAEENPEGQSSTLSSYSQSFFFLWLIPSSSKQLGTRESQKKKVFMLEDLLFLKVARSVSDMKKTKTGSRGYRSV